MNLSKRWLQQPLNLLAIAALMVLAIGPAFLTTSPAYAQDCPEGLTAEDCELLGTALAAEFDSFNIKDYSIDLTLSAGGSLTRFETMGSGPVIIGDNGSLSLDVTFDPSTLEIDGDVQSGGGALRMVDNRTFLGLKEDDEWVWYGFDNQDALDEASAATDMDLGDIDAEALGELGDLGELGMLLEDPSVLQSPYINWSRGDNIDVDDQEMAVFYIDIDVPGMLVSPEAMTMFTELIVSVFESGLLDGMDMGQGEIDASSAAFIAPLLLEMLAEDLQEDFTFRIELHTSTDETPYLTYIGTDVNITLTLEFLSGLSPEMASNIPNGGINFNFHFGAAMDQHNAEFEINAPEDFRPISELDLGMALDIDALGEGLLGPGLGASDVGSVNVSEPEFTLEAGQSMSGMLSTENEIDVYSLDLSAGDTIVLAARAESTELDLVLEVYDASGNRVADNDDNLAAPDEYELGFLDPYVEYEVPEDGTYTVQVSSFFPTEEQSYTLISDLK